MSWVSEGWGWYVTNAPTVNPILVGLGGAVGVWAAFSQARTNARRHYAQTRADQQRRLTESFSKAVEQLAQDDKIEARLGGIYTLERLAIEAAGAIGDASSIVSGQRGRQGVFTALPSPLLLYRADVLGRVALGPISSPYIS